MTGDAGQRMMLLHGARCSSCYIDVREKEGAKRKGVPVGIPNGMGVRFRGKERCVWNNSSIVYNVIGNEICLRPAVLGCWCLRTALIERLTERGFHSDFTSSQVIDRQKAFACMLSFRVFPSLESPPELFWRAQTQTSRLSLNIFTLRRAFVLTCSYRIRFLFTARS